MTTQEAIDKLTRLAEVAEQAKAGTLQSGTEFFLDAEALRLAARALRGQEIAERRGWQCYYSERLRKWYLAAFEPNPPLELQTSAQEWLWNGFLTPTDVFIAAEEWYVANVEGEI